MNEQEREAELLYNRLFGKKKKPKYINHRTKRKYLLKTIQKLKGKEDSPDALTWQQLYREDLLNKQFMRESQEKWVFWNGGWLRCNVFTNRKNL